MHHLFRDTADQDYIMARVAYRSRMYPQFHRAGLQAIEKYLRPSCSTTGSRSRPADLGTTSSARSN
jgi:hypothetical protein